jgi:hypothetical protein
VYYFCSNKEIASGSLKVLGGTAKYGGTLASMKRLALLLLAILTLSAAAAAGTIAYYRFEDGPSGSVASSITDSSGNGNTGAVLSGGPRYNSSVPISPIPQTGAPDLLSLSFGTGDSAAFNYAFPFDTLTNATLEFWVDPTSTVGENDIFWTTTGSADTNRFNIRIAPGGAFGVDYRTPTGTLHSLLLGGSVPAGQWSFIALVKSGNTYTAYINGTQITHNDVSPNLPTSTGWTINGRATEQPASCCQFAGLIDEVRLSDQALAPSQFLNTPEPVSSLLLLSGLAALVAMRRAGSGRHFRSRVGL